MRALGLDVGEKRIGLAVGDTETTLAVPADAVVRDGTAQDFTRVLGQALAHGTDALVVGMPWSLDGRSGPQAKVVATFVKQLRELTRLPVATWDERLTSVEADHRLRGVQSKGRGKNAKPPAGAQDSVAASIMLQAYLDAQHRRRESRT